MRIYVDGIGLLGPGLSSWNSSIPVLNNTQAFIYSKTIVPSPEMLPPAERRRVGIPVKVALAVGKEAFNNADKDMSHAATVFSSSGGDGDNVNAICEALATVEREVSPTRFHNSVHNAAAGYWGIAAQSREASTSLCCYDDSFAAGLLEAAVQTQFESVPVALIAYDQPYPEPLASARPISDNFGVAMIFSAKPTRQSLATLFVRYVPEPTKANKINDSQALESLRQTIPAARCLPLLQCLAKDAKGSICLDYVQGHLSIDIEPLK